MKIFCVIPAYNETGNIRELTQRLIFAFDRLHLKYKILYILQDDKSSCDILDSFKRTNKYIDYIYYPNALGIGLAYRKGFEKLDDNYSHVLTLDADLNHKPEELFEFISAWKDDKPDIIIGSRFISGGKFHDKRLWKRLLSKYVNYFLNKILHTEIIDKTSGYRLMRREAVKKILSKLRENGFTYYLEFILIANRLGVSFKEVPIDYIPRKWGRSKMGKFQTTIHYLLFLRKVFTSNF